MSCATAGSKRDPTDELRESVGDPADAGTHGAQRAAGPQPAGAVHIDYTLKSLTRLDRTRVTSHSVQNHQTERLW